MTETSNVFPPPAVVKKCPWRKAMQFPPPRDYYQRVLHDLAVEKLAKEYANGVLIFEENGPCLKDECEIWDETALCCSFKTHKETVRY